MKIRVMLLTIGTLLAFVGVFALAQENQGPIANAGQDRTVTVGEQVELDGRGSYDPDGDVLSYSWLQVEGPSVDLDGAATSTPEFTPTEAGDHLFRLTVNDGLLYSVPDSVRITVVNPAGDDDDEALDDDIVPYDPDNDDEPGCGF